MLVLLLLSQPFLNGCTESSSAPEGSEGSAVTFSLPSLTEAERTGGAFTPEIMWKMGRLGTPVLSPDGTQIVYPVTYYDISANHGQTRLMVQDFAGGDPQVLVDKGSSASWHPVEAGSVTYLAVDAKGARQLFSQSLGGKVQQLSDIPGGIDYYWFSPDGRRLLYSQSVQLGKTTGDLYPDLPLANVRIVDSLMYRHWNRWTDGKYSHLFVSEASSDGRFGAGKDLMLDEPWDAPMSPYFDPGEVTWHPNGRHVYYTCKKSTGRAYATTTNSHIYRYDAETGVTQQVSPSANAGYDRYPVISPDGKTLLWQRMHTPGYESDRAVLVSLDLTDPEAAPVELTSEWDQNADSYHFSKDGDKIHIISGIRGTYQLFTLDPLTGEIAQVTDGQWDIKWARERTEGEWIVMRTQLNRAAELYGYSNGEMTAFTHINDAIYEVIPEIRVEPRWMKTTSNEQMLSWVVYPPHFDSTKRYPAILYCQGGPQSTVSQFFSYRWNMQLLASQGYIVVMPNRHGVPSFGQAWNLQISGDYSGQNIQDYLTAIDEIAKEPWCDESRLGAVGASYGGYSIFYLAGVHENRFKALIAHNGMFNFESFYAGTEETFFPNHDFGGAYWEHDNRVAMRSFANSPHKSVHKWNTPILIIVGMNDFRIPYTEGLQAFNAAQLNGCPARLLIYPEETHFVSSPQNSIIWHHEFYGWLNRYLKSAE